MSKTLSHGQAVLLMVLSTFMWSTAGVVTRQLESASAFESTFWRAFFTFVSLLIILPLWQGRGVWARMWRSGATLWLSGACWAVMFTAFMVALTLTTVANVLVTLAAGPLLTALGARLFTGHRLPRRTWFAIGLAGLGILWIFGHKLAGGQGAGTAVALCVPVAAATNWVLVQRQRGREQPVDLVPAVWVGALLSAALTLPLAWPLTASGHDLLLLAGLGLGQLAIPCVLSVLCARVLSAPEVSLLGLLEVLFGTLLAWLGAQEVPSSQVLWGGLVVMIALMGNEWLGWRERHALHQSAVASPPAASTCHPPMA